MTEDTNALQGALNTDRPLWRETEGDHLSSSIHVTADGGIGINVGGHVIVMPLTKWHAAALSQPAPMVAASDHWMVAQEAGMDERHDRGCGRFNDYPCDCTVKVNRYRRERAALAQPTASASVREAIARIIDPEAFLTLREIAAKAGLDAANPPPGVILLHPIDGPRKAFQPRCDEALGKAREILALITPSAPKDEVVAERERVIASVWRCAIGDVVCALDGLRNGWRDSRRKADRIAGEKLSKVLDIVFASRSPAPTDYESANKLGEAIKDRVKQALPDLLSTAIRASSPSDKGGMDPDALTGCANDQIWADVSTDGLRSALAKPLPTDTSDNGEGR